MNQGFEEAKALLAAELENFSPLPAKPSLPTITAVMCVQCKRLHSVDSLSYLTIWGQITRRRGTYGKASEQSDHLGRELTPTVLCDNNSCIMEFLKIT